MLPTNEVTVLVSVSCGVARVTILPPAIVVDQGLVDEIHNSSDYDGDKMVDRFKPQPFTLSSIKNVSILRSEYKKSAVSLTGKDLKLITDTIFTQEARSFTADEVQEYHESLAFDYL